MKTTLIQTLITECQHMIKHVRKIQQVTLTAQATKKHIHSNNVQQMRCTTLAVTDTILPITINNVQQMRYTIVRVQDTSQHTQHSNVM